MCMKRIDKAFKLLRGKGRDEIITNYCPCILIKSLPDFDIDSYKFEDSCIERGCRGLTCDACWDKEIEEK